MAKAITERLLAEFPDLVERYGERGREFGIHDTAHQIAWIVNSVNLDSADLLRGDVIWLRDLLRARGFPLDPFRRNLGLAVAACLHAGLITDADVRRVVSPVLDELDRLT